MVETQYYIDQHQAHTPALAGQGADWVSARRSEYLARFAESGFPGQRDEDWKYTSVRPIVSRQFTPVHAAADALAIDGFLIEGLDSYRMIFVDGVYDAGNSVAGAQVEGLQISTFADALNAGSATVRDHLDSVVKDRGHGFTNLNQAFLADGVVVELAPGCQADKPIELIFISARNDALIQPRNLIVAGVDSQVEVVCRYVSADGVQALTNSATEVILAQGAQVDFYNVQTSCTKDYQVAGLWVRQEASSRFSCRTVTLGGALVRNDLRIELQGAGAHCDMLGLYSLGGKQHVDNHTTVVHGSPDCTSNELYKGVLNQRSRGVFHGRIKVEQDAQKTDAQQANNTLLLSRDAEIDTKPQLEIYADDVKCSHGATVGQIDETSLFYLRSRGIDEPAARSLLTFAFVNDVLKEVEIESLRDALEKVLSGQLIDTDNAL